MVDEKKFLDQNGVEYLWSQLSLEDYPNNETLIAVLNAIDTTKADKEELFSGSWNDLMDKPFGEEADGTIKTLDPKLGGMPTLASDGSDAGKFVKANAAGDGYELVAITNVAEEGA